MIYFDNAATGGQKPDGVISAVLSAIKLCANPGRSGHKLSIACAEKVFQTRSFLSDLFDGYGAQNVVFTKNCTEALNLAFSGAFKQGDHVVTTAMEHNSVLRPLQQYKDAGVIDYAVCPLTNGNVNPDEFLSLITPKTKMAVITTASNVTGAIPPIAEIAKRLPENVLLVCDGAQGGGHIPIEMQKNRIDALTLAGHKGMMGIQGSGALLFSDRLAPQPVLFGGTGTTSFSLAMPDFYPEALEAGTISFPAVVSLYEGAKYIFYHAKKHAEKVYSLTEFLINGIKKLTGYQVYSKPNPCGIVAFQKETIQSELVAEELSTRFGIAVRGGLHCAPLMHQALQTQDGGLVRASLSAFNTQKEAEELLFALSSL
ncbi:MAG: aminotransferase class V-fold PLP-dependent enzyme [Clostridia bacterium]|nr:aminotransferase class V-fold PLP-dependent enzyme [Clostridia bacterium]